MFPQNPIVFLVHANAVLQCLHSSKEVGEMSIKVLDVTKTITPLHNFEGAHSAKSNNTNKLTYKSGALPCTHVHQDYYLHNWKQLNILQAHMKYVCCRSRIKKKLLNRVEPNKSIPYLMKPNLGFNCNV